MTLLLIFILLRLPSVAGLLKWRRWSQVLGLLAVALFFAIGCGAIPAALLRALQAGYGPVAAVRAAASTTDRGAGIRHPTGRRLEWHEGRGALACLQPPGESFGVVPGLSGCRTATALSWCLAETPSTMGFPRRRFMGHG